MMLTQTRPQTEPARMFQPVPQIQTPVSLRRLFPQASFVGCAEIPVVDATERSGECGPKMLFAAIPGTQQDGARFVAEAIERGAMALLVQKPLAGAPVPQCVVPNVRRAYAELCCALAGYPSRRLAVAGVTGTNGKTTVTWLIRSILAAAGRRAGLLGTIEYSDVAHSVPSGLTTPDSKTLATWLGAMVHHQATHAAIELSSHALHQGRAAGTQLDVAVVTNVTQDHFDYHQAFDDYLASKARILEQVKNGGRAVLNLDDPGSAALCDRVGSLGLTTYAVAGTEAADAGQAGSRPDARVADLTARVTRETLAGTRFVLTMNGAGLAAGPQSAGQATGTPHDGHGTEIEICTSLIGRHNVSNCLAAAAAAAHFGIPLDVIASGIEALPWVPGRLERVDCGQPYHVFVDYAHTGDALSRCVRFLKRLTRGRVICVFGAGGDRDRSKRPLLGRAAAEADLAVVTSDNPRSEAPERIIEDILAGFTGTGKAAHVEPDREAAIQQALDAARPGDSVLIAGKGHEDVQIIGAERIPFDDREVARRILQHTPHFSERDCARMRA